MDRLLRISAGLLSCLVLVACNSQVETPVADEPTQGVKASERTASRGGGRRGPGGLMAQALPVSKEHGPDEVVRAFLEAAREGDDRTATMLLTDKAREETDREGLALDPPGTPTMKYEIGKVEYHERDPHAAYVNTMWIESSTGSTNDQFEVVWVLRRQSEGWRIAGMAAQTDTSQSPVFLNFEDPQDVARIKGQVDGEPDARVAQQPNDSSPVENR